MNLWFGVSQSRVIGQVHISDDDINDLMKHGVRFMLVPFFHVSPSETKLLGYNLVPEASVAAPPEPKVTQTYTEIQRNL